MEAEVRRFSEQSILLDLREFNEKDLLGIFVDPTGRVHVCSGNGLSVIVQNGKLVSKEGPVEHYEMVEHEALEVDVELAYVKMLEEVQERIE